ncbi:MAG TPA: hypothetical protein ENJ82_09820 [Bacteroidetes bacterium]|nr:hypothetical protein [Bacteroidota bacterium]
MGIVRKQSIQSSIISYSGAAIGFINKILIFTYFLTEEEVGLANILMALGLLFAQFSALGYINVTLRFFPYFRDKKRGHHGFLFWTVIISLIGFLFVSFNFVLWKPLIIDRFSDKSPLLVEYYYYIIPVGFFTLYFNLFESYLRSLYKTVIPTLFQEVFLRLFVTLSVLLYAFEWVNFEMFVLIYVGMICSVTLFMLIYIIYLGQLHLKPKISWRFKTLNRRMIIFGSFAFLSNISASLLYNIDSVMLADFKGMASVGIYTTTYYITALLLIPWRAIQKITSPMIADYWQENNLKAMGELYQRTSLLGFVLGAFLFVAMMTNTHNLFALMSPAYSDGLMVLVYIGITRVIDMVTGLNGYILITSKLYRYDLVLNLFLVIFAIFTNWLLIPQYGIDGAALATAISLSAIHMVRTIFIYYHFRLQPFSKPMLLVLIATFAAYSAQYFIPIFSQWWLDLLIRGFVISIVYAGTVLALHISSDANNLFQMLLKKLNLNK